MRAGRRALLALAAALILTVSGGALAQEEPLAPLLEEQIGALDLSEWEALYQQLPEEVRESFSGRTPAAILAELAAGNGPSLNAGGKGVLALLKQQLSPRLLLVSALLGLAALGAAVSQLSGGETGGAAAAGLVCYGMAILAAVAAFSTVLSQSRQAIEQAQRLMELAFPVLTGLLASAGATASAGLFQPATALLTGTVSALCQNVLLPLVLTMGVLAVVGNLSEQKPLSRMLGFVKTAVKWITGGMSTLYVGYLGIMGIAARGADGLSLRAARFAADKLVPYVGSMISGSVETLAGATALVKSGLGLFGVLLMAGLLLSPVLNVMTLQLSFRLAAALIEPLGGTRLCRGLSALGDVLGCMAGVLAAVGAMFALTVGMIAAAGSSLL